MRIRKLLKRLEYISDFAQKLKLMFDNKMIVRACQLYLKMSKILVKHSSLLSFQNILDECDEIVKKELRKLEVELDLQLSNSSNQDQEKLSHEDILIRFWILLIDYWKYGYLIGCGLLNMWKSHLILEMRRRRKVIKMRMKMREKRNFRWSSPKNSNPISLG